LLFLLRSEAVPDYCREMCRGSETGSYVRLIDFVYHSTRGLRVIKKKKVPDRRPSTTVSVMNVRAVKGANGSNNRPHDAYPFRCRVTGYYEPCSERVSERVKK